MANDEKKMGVAVGSSAPATARPPSVGPVDRDRVKAQMRRWQDRVLDLTKSNPLIGLNRSRVAKLLAVEPTANEIFSKVTLDETQLRMPLVRKRANQPQQSLLIGPDEDPDLVVEPGDISFDAKPLDLMRRIRRIHDNARTTLEERGVTTLYLTLGALRWKDDLFGDSVSPLWMVPCEFESKGPDAPLRLCTADEDAQVNPALEYYLRERHKIQLPEIPDEPDTQSLARFLRGVRRAVQEQHWDVTEEVWLSTFSFESLVIYRDLRALVDAAAAHPVIAALSGASKSAGKSESLPHDLDSLPTPTTVPIPVLPTDSSQLAALTLSSLGHHVVVHGPPGTGKSQTIANLIADALARNKKVLFVSAKMAALNVVYDRIKELGLQNFCLEAHSTKAGKQKVIDELRRTLEAETSRDGDALEREFQMLLRVRDELNAYARELHATIQPLGLSIYRANARLAQLRDIPDVRGALPWPNPLETSRDDFDQRVHALDELAGNAAVFDQRFAHPWRGFSPERFGLPEQESLESDLKAVAALEKQITPLAEKVECLIPGARSLSLTNWAVLSSVLVALAETDRLPKDWWQQSEEKLAELAQLFTRAAERRAELDNLTAAIRAEIEGKSSDLAVLLSPVLDRFGGWHAFIRPSYWKWRKQVQTALCPGIQFTRARIASLCSSCHRAVEIGRWFDEQNAVLVQYLESGATVDVKNLTAVAQSFTVAGLCRRGLAAVGKEAPQTLSLNAEVRRAAKELLGLIPRPELPPAVQRIDSEWPGGFIGIDIASRAPLPEVASRATSLLESMDRAREWVLLDRAVRRCAACGLSAFLESLEAVSASGAPRIFERRFLKLWLSSALDRSQVLAGFTAAKGSDLLEKYRDLDGRVRLLAIARAQMTASSASARVRAAEDVVENTSEVSILRRELQKRKRIKPLRKLFAEIPHVLQALKPCLLMSPISVSTFLKPEVFHFDLVVFDEASQLPTAEAVPAVLRASQVVVAGDRNQLPPTSFFEASLTPEDEDDDDATEGQTPLDSLLDECVAVVPVFQESDLRWHYRSRDERLIKFSNHFFYENKLITFPAADGAAKGQGVHLVYVTDGVYDRGRSRMNRPEARAVARLALEHFDEHPDRSLGIVSLNLSQKEAIEDAISEALLSRPDLEQFFDTTRPEAVFVKSLENVQGDERDTMIISVGYGRDQAGGISMNFGPINIEGGWRRLNVLVTRAKWECILVASLRSQDLAGVNPNNRGAVSLRGFLEFAERNCELPAEAAIRTNAETNEFEEAVRAALVDRGLAVDMQVGASRYRIDLAVRDPRDQRRYLLGIECDGASYHSARTARDRDLLRQLVLQRMGWRIHRVWSTEWFHDRDQAIASVLRSVEQAKQSPAKRPVYAPPAERPTPPPSRPTPGGSRPAPEIQRRYKPGVPYALFQPRYRLDREHLLDGDHSTTLAETIAQLVRAEGPIHHDLLVDRLKELHGVARAGSNVQSNIERALRSAQQSRGVSREAKSSFYFVSGQNLEFFRVPSDSVRRPIEQIAPSEISLAVLYLVEDQFGIFEESLPAAVARLFGIDRLRAESSAIIESVVENLVARTLLRRSGTQVHLA
jgi:very-short-patch-repair endonuclease